MPSSGHARNEGSPEPDPEVPDDSMEGHEQKESESESEANTTSDHAMEIEPIRFDFDSLQGLAQFEARMEFEILSRLHGTAFQEERYAVARGYGVQMAACSEHMDWVELRAEWLTPQRRSAKNSSSHFIHESNMYRGRLAQEKSSASQYQIFLAPLVQDFLKVVF